jgi:hypothetical protein
MSDSLACIKLEKKNRLAALHIWVKSALWSLYLSITETLVTFDLPVEARTASNARSKGLRLSLMIRAAAAAHAPMRP